MKLALRLIVILALLAVAASPAGFTVLPDFAGTSSTVHVSSSATRCAWVQVIADASNSNPVRFGDSNTSATQGLKVAAGAGYNTPVVPGSPYALSNFYVYVASGDKAYVAYGY